MRILKTIRFVRKEVPPAASPEKIEATQQLDSLVKESSEVLYRMKNVFPFDFFVDEIIVTRQRVDLIYGLFFFSKEVLSIQIENIFDVNLGFDLLFATVSIQMSLGHEDPTPVKFLKKSEAIRLRKIVTGLIATKKENMDLKSLSAKELIFKLEAIGAARQK